MRTDGTFIGIEVDDEALTAEPRLAGHLSQVCPVDIYREAGDGTVRVIKLYDGGATLQ